jgi:hypothetical protein
MAGTTGLEPAASAVTGQRSNQLNYVPLFVFLPLLETRAFTGFPHVQSIRLHRLFQPIEPNSEVNGHQAKPPSKTVLQANTNPEQLSLPVNEL